jgi:hypothetical protein
VIAMGTKNFIAEIYRSKQSAFTLNDLSVLMGEKNYDNLKRVANYYCKKGIISNIRRGFYVKDGFEPFELAVKIYPRPTLNLKQSFILLDCPLLFLVK